MYPFEDIKMSVDFKPGSFEKPWEIFINCPFCLEERGKKDEKYKMGIDLRNGLYNCFKCNSTPTTKGHISKFFDVEYSHPALSSKEMAKRIKSIDDKKSSLLIDLDLISYQLLNDRTPIAYNYMIDRGFSKSEIIRYKLRVGKPFLDKDIHGNTFESMKWSGRVIFPHFDCDGNCNYVIGRSYVGREPKYLNSRGPKSYILYGLEKVYGIAVLTEGLISGIAAERVVDVPFIPVLGKSISEWQVSLLRSKAHKVWVSFDGGALEKDQRKRIMKKLLSSGFSVYEVCLPDGYDPDDLEKDYKLNKVEYGYKHYFDNAKRILIA